MVLECILFGRRFTDTLSYILLNHLFAMSLCLVCSRQLIYVHSLNVFVSVNNFFILMHITRANEKRRQLDAVAMALLEEEWKKRSEVKKRDIETEMKNRTPLLDIS